jgi:hypothetical protein
MPNRVLRHTCAAAVVAALATAVAACGGASAAPATRTAARPPVLARSAVPYLPSRVADLTPADLLKDGPQPGLMDDLRTWGFRAGAQRTFQGRSRRLQLVVARTLEFASAGGARRYVDYVRTHASATLGSSPVVGPLRSHGRSGWLITPAACACHMAQPALVGVVSAGSRVTWLELNGPDATLHVLQGLMDQAP